MGISGSAQSGSDMLSKYATTQYELDLRMVDQVTLLPSSFNYTMQKIIQQIESLAEAVPEHPLEKYIVHHINIRFSRLNLINEEAFRAQKSFLEILSADPSRFESQEWKQLADQQVFYKLLRSLDRQYHVQIIIKQQYQHETADRSKHQNSKSNFQTIRKPIIATAQTDPSNQQSLLKRLFYSFYLRILKNNANSDQKQTIVEFHQKTGRILCLLISVSFIAVEELAQLVYQMVYIDKHPARITTHLDTIHAEYYALCLQNNYTITVPHHKLHKIKSAVCSYLEQLYVSSVREAEDPQILPPEDTLMPIRSFPVSKVSKDARQRV